MVSFLEINLKWMFKKCIDAHVDRLEVNYTKNSKYTNKTKKFSSMTLDQIKWTQNK